MATIRSWRYIHPDLDADGAFVGLGLSPQGGIAMVQNEDAVRQAILLLLSTAPGERVMRPEYGCQLQSLLFSPNDDNTAGLAIRYVKSALQRWEPRIEILSLDAGSDEHRPELLTISLMYRVQATLGIDSLAFPLDLTGEDS